MDTPKIQELTDGIIYLRPLITGDAADHLAGEDDELAKWLNGGRGTLASVEAFIRDSQENWRQGGPRRAFGVFDCGTDRLVGSMEANLTLLPGPGQVNISYGIFRPWRRRGLALRAINLMDKYLRTETDARQMVLRIAPANTASLKLAEKAGFSLCGGFDEPEGPLDRLRSNDSEDLNSNGPSASKYLSVIVCCIDISDIMSYVCGRKSRRPRNEW